MWNCGNVESTSRNVMWRFATLTLTYGLPSAAGPVFGGGVVFGIL